MLCVSAGNSTEHVAKSDIGEPPAVDTFTIPQPLRQRNPYAQRWMEGLGPAKRKCLGGRADLVACERCGHVQQHVWGDEADIPMHDTDEEGGEDDTSCNAQPIIE